MKFTVVRRRTIDDNHEDIEADSAEDALEIVREERSEGDPWEASDVRWLVFDESGKIAHQEEP